MTEPVVNKVTFAHPFHLPGMDVAHAPGTFDLAIAQDELDVWWPAYRMTMTLMLPAGAGIEAWTLTPTELEAALAADRAAILPAGTTAQTASRRRSSSPIPRPTVPSVP